MPCFLLVCLGKARVRGEGEASQHAEEEGQEDQEGAQGGQGGKEEEEEGDRECQGK